LIGASATGQLLKWGSADATPRTAMTTSTDAQVATGPFLDVARARAFIGDEDGVLDMMRMLRDSLESDVPKIGALLAQGDIAGAHQLLHPLKGFLPVFCTDELIDHVTTVEVLSKSSSSETVRAAYDAIAPELERLKLEVQSHLDTFS
jgi:HPt (histidine-containing phosphotransfer) domain-containing protein